MDAFWRNGYKDSNFWSHNVHHVISRITWTKADWTLCSRYIINCLVTASILFTLSFDRAMEKMKGSTKLGLFSMTGAMIVLGSVGCEIGKQISNYSINYYNGGSYPLPQTILVRLGQTQHQIQIHSGKHQVVLLEALKLTATFLRGGPQCQLGVNSVSTPRCRHLQSVD